MNVKQTQILSRRRTYLLALELSLHIIFQREGPTHKGNQTQKDTKHLEQEAAETMNEQIHKDLRC